MDSMYFIAVVLPKDLDERVLHYKRRMAEIYGCKVGLKSPAHITLVPPFRMPSSGEEILKNDLDVLAVHTAAFPISTANFSSFAARTLFIAVAESEALFSLKKAVDDYLVNKDYNIRKENRPFHPHITIVTKDISRKDFWIARPYFDRQKFEESFTVTDLSLLKHRAKKWDVLYTSPFKGEASGF